LRTFCYLLSSQLLAATRSRFSGIMQTKRGETNAIHGKAKYKVISGRIFIFYSPNW